MSGWGCVCVWGGAAGGLFYSLPETCNNSHCFVSPAAWGLFHMSWPCFKNLDFSVNQIDVAELMISDTKLAVHML